MSYTDEDLYADLCVIRDPEMPWYTLAELDVIAPDRCNILYGDSSTELNNEKGGSARHTVFAAFSEEVSHDKSTLRISGEAMTKDLIWRAPKPVAEARVVLKPTVPHCSLVSLIGLCVYAKMQEILPHQEATWRVVITLKDGSHVQQHELEKQMADKERVLAALESTNMVRQVRKLINYDED